MVSNGSSHHGAQDTSRLRESVSMALRQLQQPQPQPARVPFDEIPESDEAENEDGGSSDEEEHSDDGNDDGSHVQHSNEDVAKTPQRQRRQQSVSSAGSDYYYNPSPSSSEAEPGLASGDHRSRNANPALFGNQPSFPLPKQRSRLAHSSPYSTVPPTPSHLGHWSSPRKRSLSPPSPPSCLRPAVAGDVTSPRPFKRHRSAPFNHAYLALLNSDILDAAQRYAPHHGQTAGGDGDGGDDTALPASQIGLAYWSEAEKLLFFEALSRLGPDDVVGIAARVRTKSALEVGEYLALLKEATAAAKAAAAAAAAVALEDMPAAVELSQACCAALEEAADAVAIRQEGYEEGVERRKWGDTGWLIGKGNYKAVEAEPPERLRGAVGLFRLGSWLRLSERVFMNSAVEEYNWAMVEGDEPAVRATAVEDFYALAVQVTRRLVAATIYVGESRVKAKRELYPDTRNRVWRQDVEAAALSLGLPTNSRKFWAKSARRLRLNVYDDEEEDQEDQEDEEEEEEEQDEKDNEDEGWGSVGEQEPMSYDEVERALGLEPEAAEGDAVADEDTDPVPPEEDEAEKEAVMREMNEVLVHSAFEYPRSGKPRAALRNRIRAERAHEAYADRLDARATYHEEKRLWAMLERQPPVDLVKPDVPEEPRKWTKKTVEDLIRSFARTPDDWRSKLEVVPSRWEMDYALKERLEKGEAEAAAGADSDAGT
ncbi:uncharacterized protein P884DRAFT_244339 [Thermothelomyces heterothallicus CBS 202.75]|uniref:uncharacterized protein n=1 Tax=Thermothelomyces heterothallicus CBS 202.75 TaxID=1149848 RepID=UPI00374489C9